jgi:hypothetical protein
MRLVFALTLFALTPAAFAQGLFDDNEARRRVDLLRRQLDEQRQAMEARLAKAEEAAAAGADRSALIELSGQIEGLRTEVARMRGQVEVLANQADTAEARQKQLYLDIDTPLRKLEQAREQAAAAAA